MCLVGTIATTLMLTDKYVHTATLPTKVTITELTTTKPNPVVTIEDMKKCNRNTRVYEVAKPAEEPIKKPPVTTWPRLDSLTVGESGWVVYLESYNGKVYAPAYEMVADKKNSEADYETYDGVYYAHNIHVLVVKGGIKIDCDNQAFIEPQEGTPGWDDIPVVGMFRSKDKK